MPIGIVSDDDFLLELERVSSSKPQAPKAVVIEGTVVDKPSKGRSDGDNNVPDSLRKIIGETAVIDGRQAALGLAGMFGVSPSSVSAYTKGATSTSSYDEPKPSILSHINKSRNRAIKRASRTLNSALGSITQDKLDYADAKDLSGIAKDMSVIIKNLEPPPSVSSDDGVKAPQFTIYAPTFRDERSFEVINVNE